MLIPPRGIPNDTQTFSSSHPAPRDVSFMLYCVFISCLDIILVFFSGVFSDTTIPPWRSTSVVLPLFLLYLFVESTKVPVATHPERASGKMVLSFTTKRKIWSSRVYSLPPCCQDFLTACLPARQAVLFTRHVLWRVGRMSWLYIAAKVNAETFGRSLTCTLKNLPKVT